MSDNNLQYSKKFPDGTIIVVGGDNVKEFTKNYTEFRQTEVAKVIFQEATSPPKVARPHPAAEKPAQQTGETFWETLPDESVMELNFKGDKMWGEISPFPGTQYPVKVWSEVLETAPWFDNEVATYNMGGIKVGFVKNEKGYPLKVTLFGSDNPLPAEEYDDIPF